MLILGSFSRKKEHGEQLTAKVSSEARAETVLSAPVYTAP